jgi:transcriptional regulator with XRE-family HTH domain
MEKQLQITARRITELREERGWTKEQLAEISGLPIGSIHNYENCIKAPGYSSILKLMIAFDESADYIMGFSDMRRLKKAAQ